MSKIKPRVNRTQHVLTVPTNCMAVKEAAERLHKSPSSVYRIDRVNGPLRFVLTGRRVFIDRTSFEAFILTKAPEEGSLQAANVGTCQPDNDCTAQIQERSHQLPSSTTPAPVSCQPDCRQRDLPFPDWPRRRFGVLYPA